MSDRETCKGPKCSRKVRRSNGLCDPHNLQASRGQELTPLIRQARRGKEAVLARDEQGRKHCIRCDAWKAPDSFVASKRTEDGLSPWCGRCTNLSAYSLTPADYGDLLARQGGACAGCGCAPVGDTPLVVDHDHNCCNRRGSCGRCVRGLLCMPCNRALGLLKDSATTLRTLADYITR